MSDAPSGENFYLRHDRYWVAPDEEADYPVRQGDLFADVEVAGERWPAALLIHPTCELPKVSVGRVQVARVHLLDELGDRGQRARVVAGLSVETNGVRIRFAHTFFLAPARAWRLGQADVRQSTRDRADRPLGRLPGPARGRDEPTTRA